MRKGNGEIWTSPIEKGLQIGVRFGLSRKGEIEVGLAREAGFTASEPIDIGFDEKRGGYFFVGRDGQSGEENGGLFVAVADEGGDENFFGKRKLQGAGGPAGREFPKNGRGEAGIARIFPVDVPTGAGAKAKAKGDGFSRLKGGGFGEEIHGEGRGLGRGGGEKRGGQEEKAGAEGEKGGDWGGHEGRVD